MSGAWPTPPPPNSMRCLGISWTQPTMSTCSRAVSVGASTSPGPRPEAYRGEFATVFVTWPPSDAESGSSATT